MRPMDKTTSDIFVTLLFVILGGAFQHSTAKAIPEGETVEGPVALESKFTVQNEINARDARKARSERPFYVVYFAELLAGTLVGILVTCCTCCVCRSMNKEAAYNEMVGRRNGFITRRSEENKIEPVSRPTNTSVIYPPILYRPKCQVKCSAPKCLGGTVQSTQGESRGAAKRMQYEEANETYRPA